MRNLIAAFAVLVLALLPAQASPASSYSGTTWTSFAHDGGVTATIQFNADGSWTESSGNQHQTGKWQADAANGLLTVTRSDGLVFHFRLNPNGDLVRDPGKVAYQLATNPGGVAASPVSPAAANAVPASATGLSDSQRQAVVVVKGDNAEGTGFLVKTKDGPVVVTNIHVISNNPNLRITTNTGVPVAVVCYKGASDRDLAMIAIKDGAYNYLTLATDVSGAVGPGDTVITPGNSQGGDVILNTSGTVLGLGPDRVEFSNPIYHGNSGGPIFHVKSGQVIGVVTEAMKVDVSNELDKTSFAIRSSMRYFGLRLDNVPQWETYDWNQLQTETAFLDRFNLLSRCLDSYLNSSGGTTSSPGEPKKKKHKKKDKEPPQKSQPGTVDPAAEVWLQNDKLVKANTTFDGQIAGSDTSQQMDALRELFQAINDLAGTDVAAIQDLKNFYTFDQQRARDEMAYRKAIKLELDGIGTNVSRLTSLPRSNR